MPGHQTESGTAFYAFDLLRLNGVDLHCRAIEERRKLLEKLTRKPLKQLLSGERTEVRLSPMLDGSGQEVFEAVKRLGLEGVVGKRSGAWNKHRANLEQELVVGGYTPGTRGFESLIVGFYEGKRLQYCARVKNGFVPRVRDQIFPLLKQHSSVRCPFANLPEPKGQRFGESLTAEKMKECRWVKPLLVCQVAFLEWTQAAHLRHSSFVAMRDDKAAGKVVRET